MEPFTVLCEQNIKDPAERKVTSTLFHRFGSSEIVISEDHEPGSVKTSLDYGITIDQIDHFVDGFEKCMQVSADKSQ